MFLAMTISTLISVRLLRCFALPLLAAIIAISNSAWAQSSVSGVNTLSTALPIGADGQIVMTVFDNGTNGYVGIGTTEPSYKLDVAGDINLSAGSYLRQNGALAFITSAASSYSTFVGQSSGTAALFTGGVENTSLGFGALQSGTTAQNNTAVGVNALALSKVGIANTAVGLNALMNSTSSYNTALGASTGNSLTTGAQNIVIGFDIDVPVPGGVGQINIGNAIYATGATGTGVTPAGNVGIGLPSPGAPLDVNGGMRGNNSGTVAGAACTPEGMLAYDMTNHQPIYCTNGAVWGNVNSDSAYMNRQWSYYVNTAHDGSSYAAVNTKSYPIDVAVTFFVQALPAQWGQLQVSPNGSTGWVSVGYCAGQTGYYTACQMYATVPPGGGWAFSSSSGGAQLWISLLQ
jgi:hypothetical protein